MISKRSFLSFSILYLLSFGCYTSTIGSRIKYNPPNLSVLEENKIEPVLLKYLREYESRLIQNNPNPFSAFYHVDSIIVALNGYVCLRITVGADSLAVIKVLDSLKSESIIRMPNSQNMIISCFAIPLAIRTVAAFPTVSKVKNVINYHDLEIHNRPLPPLPGGAGRR